MGMIANTQLKAARGPLLLDWRPEDPEFWARNGKRIASRNLWISIPALLKSIYGDLEERVEDKTRALSQSHQRLELLYASARRLGENPYDSRTLHLAEQLRAALGLGLEDADETVDVADVGVQHGASGQRARVQAREDLAQLLVQLADRVVGVLALQQAADVAAVEAFADHHRAPGGLLPAGRLR